VLDIEDEWWDSLTEEQKTEWKKRQTPEELTSFQKRRDRFKPIPEHELKGDEWFLNQ
jgi:hypothetical protein